MKKTIRRTGRPTPSGHVLLFVGTRHGLFLYRAGVDRRRFELRGEALLGMDVADVAAAPGTDLIYAAASGRAAGVYVSRDEGRSWTRRGAEIGAQGFTLVAPVGEGSKTVYAAASSALLHRSTDAGETWHPIWSLNEHPSRREWQDTGCGLNIMALAMGPDSEQLWAAVTGAGVFRSDDGGLSWTAANAGVPSHASPLAIFDGLGRCPHNLARSSRGVLWLACHDGVYRSSDRGESWSDCSKALPARFGQALALHPREETAFVVPESLLALTSNGDLALWRGTSGGREWERAGRGLPSRAHVNVAPRALGTDALEPVALYLGTSSGKVFASLDGGLSFSRVAEDLPSIRSVHATFIAA